MTKMLLAIALSLSVYSTQVLGKTDASATTTTAPVDEKDYYNYYVSRASSPDCAKQMLKSDACVKGLFLKSIEVVPIINRKATDE